jgi:PIN domain nuclease of toxin-antitoxin system
VILLDTHVIHWLLTRPERLSKEAARSIRAAARKGRVAIASISLWELALLARNGRIRVEGSVEAFLNRIAAHADVDVLELTPEIAVLATQFPSDFPADPADRIIAATARAHGLRLVTRDARLQDSPLLSTLW